MCCPYCMQGSILKAKVKANDLVVFICDECDTVWKESDTISDQSGKCFYLLANELSIEPLWDELEILE